MTPQDLHNIRERHDKLVHIIDPDPGRIYLAKILTEDVGVLLQHIKNTTPPPLLEAA